MFQSGQLVRVNLAGLPAEGLMFQAVTDAVAHIVNQTSEQPPTYLVKLLFSFRGVTEVEVPPTASTRTRKWNREKKKPTHAAHEWGTQNLFNTFASGPPSSHQP
jgi:hypothetical protein